MMNTLRMLALFGVCVSLFVGCASPNPLEPNDTRSTIGGPLEEFSGGVPITARKLAIGRPNANTITITVSWIPAPTVDTTATFRYLAMDWSNPSNPTMVPNIADVLEPIPADMDGDGVYTIPLLAGTQSTQVVFTRTDLTDTYRVIVLVSAQYDSKEYVGAGWFEAQ